MIFINPAIYFTVQDVFINFDRHSPDLGRDTYLAPEGLKWSISSPWSKKVVHHCHGTTLQHSA